MRIGELAKSSGTSVQTLRYYEREGILRQPPRTAAGYRAYTASDLEHVRFVRNCQRLGFSLGDIRQLAAMHGTEPAQSAGRGCPSPPTKKAAFIALSRQRIEYLDGKIAGLRGLRRQVALLLRRAEDMAALGCPANPLMDAGPSATPPCGISGKRKKS